MKKTTLAIAVAGVVGALGITSVASAMDFSVYGSIRAGVYQNKTDDTPASVPLNIMAKKGRDALETGVDNFGSRIGMKGSEDLGNGSSAGFHFERSADDAGRLKRRHENVWIKGGWGKLTLGQSGNIFRNAANWDQSYWLGGVANFTNGGDGGSRVNAITYNSNISGPFSFGLQAVADDAGVEPEEAMSEVTEESDNLDPAGRLYTLSQSAEAEEEGIDAFTATAHFDAGLATINLGYRTDNQDTNEFGSSYDNIVISANGGVGGLSWYVGYEQADDNTGASVTVSEAGEACSTLSGDAVALCTAVRSAVLAEAQPQDKEILGVFLGYAIGERDNIYLEFEDVSVDGAKNVSGLDFDATLVGYSHNIGPGVTFIAEYSQRDFENIYVADNTQFWAGIKLDF